MSESEKDEYFVKWSAPYRGENVAQPEFDLIRMEKKGQIGRIILNSPEKRNPLGYERLMQLEMAAKLFELDDDIRVIIIKGEGPSFSAGYDITPIKKGERPRNMPAGGYIHPDRDWLWQSYNMEHMRVYLSLFDLQKPVIAQIQGHCLAGGSELAGFCDIRIVADDARIGWPVGRNWSPGNVQYIPWLIGMTRAKHYMFTCEEIDGKKAAEYGWASESVPAEELEAHTEAVAQTIAQTPTDLIMLTKRSINRQFELMGFKTGLACGNDFLALSSFRDGSGIYSAKSELAGEGGDGGDDEFMRISQEQGLKAAVAWRDSGGASGNGGKQGGKNKNG